MLVPIGTDLDGPRRVIAVPVLIALNVACHAAMRSGVGRFWTDPDSGISPIRAWIEFTAFNPRDVHWWQWVTSLFTHSPDGWFHIVGNMIFLWAFGKPLESHIGAFRFVLLYFLGGFAACAAHWLVSSSPAIGASGAVSAVAGLFICFFPRSHTRVLYLLMMSVMVVPSAWLIGLFVTIDVLRFLMDATGQVRSGVASGAHLGGTVFGVLGGLLLLKLGIVKRTDWDLLYVMKQFWRRRQMRAALRGASGSPWMSGKPVGRVAKAGPLDAATAKEAELRALVSSRLRERKPAAAVEAYRELVSAMPQSTLQPELQLDIANHALACDEGLLAVQAYTSFLRAYPNDSKADEVKLLLALVYLRRLHRPADAKPLLANLDEKLTDPAQRDLARALRAECAA
ncbi:MAG: rhomboid family intramembrane serine protease [Phycisphaerae bacterium]|nr:rhomboid family intramembrane serine protease [Phycisphaerae bacterium]